MIRDARDEDVPAILAIAAGNVVETGPLDEARFQTLWGNAAAVRVAQVGAEVAAFMVLLRETAPYDDSPNFTWFRDRYDRFLYVDRVIVAPAYRRRGLASRLYDDAADQARSAGVERLTCEVNLEPRNDASLSFHRTRGFVEVGTLRVRPEKVVSLQVLEPIAGGSG